VRYVAAAVLAFALLLSGCTRYYVKVRLYDTRQKPVMDAGIAVEGNYIAGYGMRGGVKQPVLRKFYASRRYSYGELAFGVRNMPHSFRVSADAPGFHKCIARAQIAEQGEGYAQYRVMDVNSPYSPSSIIITLKGNIVFIDAFLMQIEGWRGRRRR
jgi:hypothetical protein